MRAVPILMMLCLAACGPSKSASKLHTIRMDADGVRVYDYQIGYGKSVLPGGNRGLSDFAGGFTYQAKMPLPEVAVASWRTAPAPGGTEVRFVVPIREQVTEEEWNGYHFALEFYSTPTTLKVNVTNGIPGNRWHPEKSRQIYSSTAKPGAP